MRKGLKHILGLRCVVVLLLAMTSCNILAQDRVGVYAGYTNVRNWSIESIGVGLGVEGVSDLKNAPMSLDYGLAVHLYGNDRSTGFQRSLMQLVIPFGVNLTLGDKNRISAGTGTYLAYNLNVDPAITQANSLLKLNHVVWGGRLRVSYSRQLNEQMRIGPVITARYEARPSYHETFRGWDFYQHYYMLGLSVQYIL